MFWVILRKIFKLSIRLSLYLVKVEWVFAVLEIFCESPQNSWAVAGVTAVADIIAVVGVTSVWGVRIKNSRAWVPLRIFIINVHNFL